MNCIYRIVWNTAIGKWVVASELASGRRRRARTGSGLALLALGLATASPNLLAGEIHTALCTAAEAAEGHCDAAPDAAIASTGSSIQAEVDDALMVVSAGSNANAASTNGINMIAIGSNAIARPSANGANSGVLALGANANAAGSNALAIGYGASADSLNGNGTSGATALGASARAAWNATALGFQANGQGTVVTAVGAAASARGERSIALGSTAVATGQYSAAIGAGASATHTNSVALGQGAQSRGTATFAVGSATRRRQIAELADGSQANDAVTVQQLRATLAQFGGAAGVDDQGAVVAPTYTLANGGVQTSVGGALAALDGGRATLDLTVNALELRLRNGQAGLVRQQAAGDTLSVGALHDGAALQLAGSDGARRLRGIAEATDGGDAINLGQLQHSVRSAAAGLGGGAELGADGLWRAPRYQVSATQHRDIGSALSDLDARTDAQRDDLADLRDAGVAVQRYFQANGSGSDAAQASGAYSVAAGSAAAADGRHGIAIGASAIASGEQSIAIGAGAQARGDNAIALGAGAVANRDYVLSVGSDAAGGAGRQIINVANGTEGTDAVNIAQLRAVVAALGGGAAIDPLTGVVTGPRYAVQGSDYSDAGSALAAVDGGVVAIDGRVTLNDGDLLAMWRQLADWDAGVAGLVQQGGVDAAVSVGAASAGNSVDVTGTDGARQLKGVANAQQGSDAINLEQMRSALAGAQPQQNRYLKVDGAADGSDDAQASGRGAMALGAAAAASADNAGAFGHAAQAQADGSVALGAGAVADRAGTVSVGAAGAQRQISHVADASQDTDAINLRQLKSAGLVGAGGALREAVGYAAGSQHGLVSFGGAGGTLLGNLADGRIASGSREAVNGGQVAAWHAQLDGQLQDLDGRVDRLGGQGGGAGRPPYYDASAGNASDGTVLVANGDNAQASGQGAVAAGAGAQATADNAVALGAGSVADRADVVSVGQAGAERQIGNVQAGLYETDAVNVGQLREQMATVNSYTDQRVDALWDSFGDDIGQMRRQVNRGIAASAALVQVTPNLPGKVTLNAGVARYRGESAFGLGLSRWSRSGRYNVNAGVSAARGDQPLLNIGFGIAFD